MDDDSAAFVRRFDDPRVSEPFCRHLVPVAGDHDDPTHDEDFADDDPTHDAETADPGHAVTLLGVVHDHPASAGRVEAVLSRLDPDVLALELPAAAVPLYRAYAAEADAGARPRLGGEMSAAVAAASGAEVVGVDAPNWSFARRLVARLVADRVRPSTARRVLASLGGATRQAVACRLAATVTNATSVTVAADDPVEYACSPTDSPARQASHERSHVSGVRALLAGADGGALDYRDATRERCMVDRLRDAREQGDVVAVVGVDHLDALAAGLGAPARA